jgi:transposase
MDTEALNLPEETDTLKAFIASQARQHRAQLANKDERIAGLEEQIRLLLAKRFGTSSEKVSQAQLGLFNEAELEAQTEQEPETVSVPAHERKRGKRKPLPASFERVDVIHDLDESDKRCPHHDVALEHFGEDTSEQFEIIPATMRVLVHKRLKYRCPCCVGTLVRAPMPPQPIPKSIASPGLLAYIVVAKYLDALPLYRQEQIFARLGVELSRATMSGWVIRMGELVQPFINLLREQLLECPYIHMDETTLQVLKEPGKSPESKSYLWCQMSTGPERPIVLFEYDPGRSSEVPKRLLEGFSGTLHVDGYAGYSAVVRNQDLNRLFCNAHARRKFTDALKAQGLNPNKLPDKPPDKAKRALKAVGFYKSLYTIERRIKDEPPGVRYEVRQRESVPVLKRFKVWADKLHPKVAPSSKLGQALSYLLNHWDGLVRYCEDGRFDIDNNAAERTLRPFCIGRNNWKFADTQAGARASAQLYSIIQTAKANGHEPYAYLRHIFTELPKATTVEDIEALLPYRLDPATLKTQHAASG